MAFTDTQKNYTREYLGYPLEQWTITFISDRMNAVSLLSSEAESRIGDLLTILAAIETKRSTYITDSAGVETFDRTDGFYKGQALLEINYQFYLYQQKLSDATNVPVWNDSDSGFRIMRS
jgi:hypothetical protein